MTTTPALITDMIARCVKVNRSRTPQQMLDATRRTQYGEKDILGTMPKDGLEEVDVHFFRFRRARSEDELAKEYELRGLKPDPFAQGAVMNCHPDFAYMCPNRTTWQDANGNICYLKFDEDYVEVDQFDDGSARWWHVGVPK